jgi:hypothetical protein
LDEDEKACFIDLSIQEFRRISDEQTGLYLRVLHKTYEILGSRSYISAKAFKKRCSVKMMRLMMHATPEQWRKFSKEVVFFGGKILYLKYLLRRLRLRRMS